MSSVPSSKNQSMENTQRWTLGYYMIVNILKLWRYERVCLVELWLLKKLLRAVACGEKNCCRCGLQRSWKLFDSNNYKSHTLFLSLWLAFFRNKSSSQKPQVSIQTYPKLSSCLKVYFGLWLISEMFWLEWSKQAFWLPITCSFDTDYVFFFSQLKSVKHSKLTE